MIEMDFNTIPQLAGFRLGYLEVLNWGTFNQHTWRIDLDGYNSLLTGDIGSGKSTLVDALTCLLVPYQKITFNKAAGAESKERNLLTYVKGEFKKEKGEITRSAKKVFLRPDDNTYSVIIANFKNAGYDENVCLAQLLWIKDGKVDRLFISSTSPLTIREHFSNFTDINELRKRLRKNSSIEVYDSFSQYSEYFRRRFGMTSDKAIDLFYQTVSMKSVSSLTDFVRDQMLERTDVREHIAALLKRFDDLNKAHAAVVNSREQHQILKPLVEYAADYEKIIKEIDAIEQMLKAVPAWFGIQKQALLVKATTSIEDELEIARQSMQALSADLSTQENKQLGLAQDIYNSGGRRLEQISEELVRREKAKQEKKKSWDDYDALAKRCGLNSPENETTFFENIQTLKSLSAEYQARESDLRMERDQVVIDLRKSNTELEEENAELASLRERKTQVPAWLIGFRRQLCQDLRIAEDELPFAGELLKVNNDESPWEGAIERLLHDFGISLLVPSEHYKTVSHYVNSNVLKSIEGRGMKLTYLDANINNNSSIVKQVSNESIVNKLEIKPDTNFYTWIENYLHSNYGNCECVDIEELQHIPYGITKEGLIKSSRIRHIKDDRKNLTDRRNYVLGWTNTEKIKTLEHAILRLQEHIQLLSSNLSKIEKEEQNIIQLKEAATFLLYAKEYASINWYTEVDQIYQLEQERKELLDNNDRLKVLKEKLEEVKKLIIELKLQEAGINQKIGKLQEKKDDYARQLASCNDIITQVDEALKQQYFPFIDNHQKENNFRLTNIDSQQEQFRKLFEGDTGELKKLRTRQSRLITNLLDKMRDIKEHSKAEYSELVADVEARNEFIEKYNKLVKEDLKRHEERFKEELNRNTIHSIAVFDSQLEKHEKEIKSKIHHINQHLREIVYDSAKGTYITIQMDSGTDARIRLFKEDLKRCYMHSLSGGKDLYTEEKYEQVKKILDRFASGDPIDKEWANTVTDVRQWFEFNASERFEADHSEKEFYEGSGGKSGGQKEKLAYTILASALAYQFGLQFGENKSRSFRFVVIDEAFGRGSDESTRYGLELFKKLNLQLLIVTPLQKIHIIENHVNSFHFVSNREGNNSQVSNFTLLEYNEEKARRNSMFREPNPAV